MRPDVIVRVLCENASAALGMFRTAMGKALGMDARAAGERLLVSEAGDWTAFPRARVLLSTLPYLPDGG
eukprot:192413-Lingulodinium_polyedra.AAC.1